MTLLVPLHANHVQIRPTLVEKEETRVASIAPLDGRPKTAVPNVLRVVPVHLATVAKIAPWGLREKETTWMRHNVVHVNWAKPPRLKGPLLAVDAI